MLPSIGIGAVAYGAGELLFHNNDKNNFKEKSKNLYDTLADAKEKNNQIEKMSGYIEDKECVVYIKEIYGSVKNIIETVEKRPEKYKKMNNFFEYYLPVTLNILKRYDEIENQKLTTTDSKEFMDSTKSMLKKISEAFKNQLSNLYKSDMIDTDAEMKVFETMLKTDGYDQEDDFKIK